MIWCSDWKFQHFKYRWFFVLYFLVALVDSLKFEDPISLLGIDGKPKRWILLMKLGNSKSGANCQSHKFHTHSSYVYECGLLYADDSNPRLSYINQTVHDQSSPLFQSWKYASNQDLSYSVWNDQSGPTSFPHGPGSPAHDKGFLIHNNQTGILCSHSCPNWLYYPSNFRSIHAFDYSNQTSGDFSTYSQTFFLLALQSTSEINQIRQLLSRENVRWFYKNSGSVDMSLFPEYDEPDIAISTAKPEANFISYGEGLTIFAKHRNEHYDYWQYFAESFCSAQEMSTVWTYVECGEHILKSTRVDDYNCKERSERYGKGSKFGADDWYPNHMKLGYCHKSNSAAIAGWNHKDSQLKRGSLFVVIQSETLRQSFSSLFPTQENQFF